MNLLLLGDGDFRPDGTVRLTGRRARHVAEVLRAAPGDRLAAGRIGGGMGTAVVLVVTPQEAVLEVRLDAEPPPPSAVALLVALPRPKILRRVLQAAAAMGIKRLVLLGSYRVEKSYFASPLLEPSAIEEQLRLGLEQGRDTRMPEVLVRRWFKPFVEDELDALFPDTQRLLAHPGVAPLLDALAPPRGSSAVLAVGPEGGWTAYEASQLEARGFARFSLGPRVLRVDAAVAYAVGQVELWLRNGRFVAAAPRSL